MLPRLLIPALVLAAAGCSSNEPMPMATTAEKAKPAIDGVFAAWKAGKTADDLKAQSPPVYFLDADFEKGRKITDYKIEGDGRPFGTGYQFLVSFTFDTGGKPKKLAYRVVTSPTTTINREDQQP